MQVPKGGMRRGAWLVLALLLAGVTGTAAHAGATAAEAPPTLGDTGLYADFARREIVPEAIGFAPQYPLWTDGATKRRWIALPPSTAIDATDPDAWVFPVGTRFWKEFAFGGRPVETRFIERRPDGWLYAAYVWNADLSAAPLAPVRGLAGTWPLPGGRSHVVPATTDCRVCHESGASRVLGFSLLQLSPDRDPGALHLDPADPGLDLATLVEAGLVVNLPPALVETPPRIAARTETERAALGYLHGNCGHCHNGDGPLAKLGLRLRHVTGAAEEPGIATTVDRPVADPAPGETPATLRIAPGDPGASAVAQRIGSRWAALQMPPLGTEIVDQEATELIRQWIAGLGSEGEE